MFADTLRSVAVIVAAVVAEIAEAVTSEVADATAAVVVSALILLSLVPLFSGLVRTFSELQSISGSLEELRQPRRRVYKNVLHRRLLDHEDDMGDSDDEYSEHENV